MLVEILMMSLPLFTFIIYLYLRWNYNYWEKKGIPFIEGIVPFGNIKDIFFLKTTMGQLYSKIYRDFPEEPLVGFFKMRQPILLVRNPDIIRIVLMKDFSSFHDNDFPVDYRIDPILAYNPFSLTGTMWKTVRSVGINSITPPKIKDMIPLMAKECEKMIKFIDQNLTSAHEGKWLCGHYTADVVASCAFGKECDSFNDPNNKFRLMTNRVLNGEFISNMAVLLIFYAPALEGILRLRMIPKEVQDYFQQVVKDIAKARLKDNVSRNDVLQMLLNDNIEAEAKGDKPVYSYEEIMGHCMNFILDGYNTSAIAMSMCLHELAMNPECQKRAREEILAVEPDFDLYDYSKLQDLVYLDQVIFETLRLYPPVPQITRICTKDTTLTHNGKEYSISRNTPVAIPVLAIHMDPEYYPEPETFNPDRFAEEQKAARHRYVYLPFGEGPRICLGIRFSNTQLKMGLAAILLNYEIIPNDPNKKVEMDPASSFLFVTKDGVWLKFKKLQT